MKIALVIMDGLEQFVLTPETDVEKRLVAVLADRKEHDIAIHRGEFYSCRGGWYRQGTGTESAIICLSPKAQAERPKIALAEGVIADASDGSNHVG